MKGHTIIEIIVILTLVGAEIGGVNMPRLYIETGAFRFEETEDGKIRLVDKNYTYSYGVINYPFDALTEDIANGMVESFKLGCGAERDNLL